MSGKLIIMVGLPRSGKSTWIEDFRKKNDCIVVSNDWIRENVFHVKYYHSINPALWTISDGCIRIVLGQDKTVVVDGVHHTKFVRGEFIKTGKDMGADIEIIHIDTSFATCFRRNDKLPNEKLIQMADEFEIPTNEEAPVTIIKETNENSSN